MSEGTEQAAVVESKAPPEVQKQAEAMGWIPPSRFKGDAEHFVDADVYVERGETMLPIIKARERAVRDELATVKAEAKKNADALAAAQKAIEEIEVRHSAETQRAVAEAKKQVKAQLAAASEANDHEAVAELTDQLTQLNAAKEAPPPAKKVETLPVFVPPPELVAWNEDNPWYGKDKKKTALALGIAEELRVGGETSTGRVFLDKVAAEVEAYLAPKGESRQREDKVEGARGGSEGDRGSRAKGYASLPAEAKAVCDADGRRFVGDGKRFKDMAAWRSHYASIFFEKE